MQEIHAPSNGAVLPLLFKDNLCRLLSESNFRSNCLISFIDFSFSCHYIQLLLIENGIKNMYYSLNILCIFLNLIKYWCDSSPENGLKATVKRSKRNNKKKRIETL